MKKIILTFLLTIVICSCDEKQNKKEDNFFNSKGVFSNVDYADSVFVANEMMGDSL